MNRVVKLGKSEGCDDVFIRWFVGFGYIVIEIVRLPELNFFQLIPSWVFIIFSVGFVQ